MRRLFSSSICQSCHSKSLLQQSRRSFATTTRLRAAGDELPSATSAPGSGASEAGSLFQNASDAQAQAQQQQRSQATSNAMGDLAAMVSSRSPRTRGASRGSVDTLFNNPFSAGDNRPANDSKDLEPFVLHIKTHKHNTHLALTGPFPPVASLRGPHDRRRAIVLSSGSIGLKKAGRGSYDAAYQLSAFLFGAINERDILPMIQDKGLEVRYNGFGKGREAVTKALLGQEGRFLRGKVTRVSDVTPLKFGGVRSRKPRRLG